MAQWTLYRDGRIIREPTPIIRQNPTKALQRSYNVVESLSESEESLLYLRALRDKMKLGINNGN